MAIVCVLCKMLCVLFALISSFSATCSASDNYLYRTDVAPLPVAEYVSVVLQTAPVHVLHKRQATNATSADAGAGGGDAQSQETPATPPRTITSNMHADEFNTEVQVLKANATMALTPPHNLGVNGTGIRKNITQEAGRHAVTAAPTVQNRTGAVANTTAATGTSAAVANQTEAPLNDDLVLNSFSDEAVNKTMAQNNITKSESVTHEFYNSTLTAAADVGRRYWVDMANNSEVKVHELLSQSHRRAATVRLSFDFPFYGHVVRNVTVATGGFLYTGEYVHSWLAATQYIAPLMANFDTSLSNDSFVKYVDNGTAFTVQWEKVALQDKPHDGEFTFQTTLHINGDIVFVYRSIPVVIEQIQDDYHPVKVGLSDAYISDRTIFYIRRKTIYEYHRVNFNRQDIKNWTAIYLRALPTCLSNKDCVSCVSKPTSAFTCAWCPGTNRCSSGMDRHRQDWLLRGCERKKIRAEAMCSAMDAGGVDLANGTADEASAHYVPVAEPSSRADDPRQASRVTNDVNIRQAEKPVHMGVSGIVTILFLITLVLSLSVWVLYAYRNPHSASGQILIRKKIAPVIVCGNNSKQV